VPTMCIANHEGMKDCWSTQNKNTGLYVRRDCKTQNNRELNQTSHCHILIVITEV